MAMRPSPVSKACPEKDSNFWLWYATTNMIVEKDLDKHDEVENDAHHQISHGFYDTTLTRICGDIVKPA